MWESERERERRKRGKERGIRDLGRETEEERTWESGWETEITQREYVGFRKKERCRRSYREIVRDLERNMRVRKGIGRFFPLFLSLLFHYQCKKINDKLFLFTLSLSLFLYFILTNAQEIKKHLYFIFS